MRPVVESAWVSDLHCTTTAHKILSWYINGFWYSRNEQRNTDFQEKITSHQNIKNKHPWFIIRDYIWLVPSVTHRPKNIGICEFGIRIQVITSNIKISNHCLIWFGTPENRTQVSAYFIRQHRVNNIYTIIMSIFSYNISTV